MAKLGIAVIGTGKISAAHISSIKAIDDVELRAIMSHNAERAENIAKEHNAKAYSNIDELLKDESINIVDIISYHDVHAGYALKAVKAGKHVIVEKPIGISMESIDEINEEAKNRNLKITVISQSRLDKAFIEAKRMIDAGELGKVLFVNADLLSDKFVSDYEKNEWKTKKEKAGGGILIMKAVHMVDVLLWMFGNIESVYGKIGTLKHNIEVEDIASAFFRMKNGAIISMHTAGCANYKHPFRITVYGEKKAVIVESGKITEILNDTGSSIVRRLRNKMPIELIKTKRYGIGTIDEQIKSFIKGITENKEINELASVSDGKNALEAILAIYKSSKTGREVKIK